MQFRTMQKTGLKISTLGFGCMRLPILDSEKQINIPLAKKMLRYAIDQGVNYVDTAWGYHGGTSELFLKEALADGYRQKVYLADKMPVWECKTTADFERLINIQLDKCGTDHFDFYLLHALNKSRWDSVHGLGVLKFLDDMKARGKIKFAGFSYHDGPEPFNGIVDAYPWDFVQIQLNYMDTGSQQGIAGYHYLTKKNIPVMIMEPLKGGKICNPPASVAELFNQHPSKRTAAEWALRWAADLPNALVILSGMSTMEQTIENVAKIDAMPSGIMTKEDQAFIAKLVTAFNSIKNIGCTDCKYCMPCPHGVNIPRNFFLYNEVHRFNALERIKVEYNRFFPESEQAHNCKECGECEPKCPQQLKIIDLLKDVDKTLKRA
jgi:uncharacterized protein